MFMWYSNDMFHYMLKAEFVTLYVSIKLKKKYLLNGGSLKGSTAIYISRKDLP